MKPRHLLCVAALALSAALAACSSVKTEAPPPVAASAPSPKIPPWGFDLEGRDVAVKPGDDFFEYAGGVWMKKNQIPDDRTRWGAFDQLRAAAEEDVRVIADEAGKKNAAPGTNDQKVGDYYKAFMDVDAIEKLGLAPAKVGLDRIAAAKTHEDIAALIHSPDISSDGPINLYIYLDAKNPDRYVVNVTQSGLSLPDREYYLNKKFAEIVGQFGAHVERMMTLAGDKNAKAEAKTIIALETAIAKQHWAIEKRRDVIATYNLMSVAALKKRAPAYPWDAAFAAAKLSGQTEVNVNELSAIPPLATTFRKTPVATWRVYLKYHYLNANAAFLPKAFDEESFAFYGKTLNGQPKQRDRWKRAVASLNGALGEAVGPSYVEKHFPPEAKAKMDALVENLRKGYAAHIKALPWMTEDTKKVALEKLAAFRPKIGYPSKWRSFDGLEVKPGEALANHERSAAFEWQYELSKLGKPSDREIWQMTPQTVNAYYEPTFNEIVFPAAILQPPFFDPNADPAVNYGGIGGVIGHEMGHGFDDQGAKQDAKGILRTWWKKEDEDAFAKLTAGLATQYSTFEPLPGIKINGELTLGENIGDLGGLTMAREAYLISLNGAPPPVLDGVTADQRFFYGWAQVWRGLIRDPALRNQILSDPHSPQEYRVNGVVRNIDAWYDAFSVKPGDKLYLAPDKRVKIW
jgi:predicted metalloendopeptidase